MTPNSQPPTPNSRQRLDTELAKRGLCQSRSHAERIIEMGQVMVNGRTIKKPSYRVSQTDKLRLKKQQYVSRAAYKLESVVTSFNIDFTGKTMLDVGSSTGGFSDFALKHGAKKVIAVDVGTNQLHPSLRTNPRIELHEKTDIRDIKKLSSSVDIVTIDVSFISLTKVLPAVKELVGKQTVILAMAKPQFEAKRSDLSKGVLKNSKIRREVLKNLELWLMQEFVVLDKADSGVAGIKGNEERFYKLKVGR